MGHDLSRVVDALPGLVWITQADGRSDFVNRRWCEYTGLGADNAFGLGWQTAIHPHDLKSFFDSWDAIKQSGVAQEIDVRLRRHDGEYRWFVFRPSPFSEDVNGRHTWCWLGLYADETPAGEAGATPDGRLRRFMDMLPIPVGFLNAHGVTVFVNRQALKDYDTSLDELREWTKIHTDDYPVVYEHLTRLLTTGEMYDGHHRMRHKNGTYRWMRARILPCRDAHGNIVRYVSCQIDVHDLKRAQDLLAAEVKLLEMVARGVPLQQVLGALSHHLEELCNGCSCSILVVAPDRKQFQFGAGHDLPETYGDILAAKTAEGAYDPYSLAVIEKTSIIIEDLANDPRWKGSVRLSLMKTYGYASCWSMPIMCSSGEATGIFAIYRREAVGPTTEEREIIDRFAKIAGIVIERAQADAALLTSERELRGAHAQLSKGQRLSKTGSFTSDLQLDRHHWSDELFRIFEIGREVQLSVQAVRDRVHPDDLVFFDREIQRGIEDGEGDFTFRIVTPTGGVKYLRGVSEVIEDVAGRPIFMGALQDVTASKVAEESLNRARSELAHVARVATLNAMTASIGHEVSQPLAGILTNADTCLRMLAADPPNLNGAAETARRTIRDANRASEVIKRLRAMFARKPPTVETVDLNGAAQEVIALSASELRRGRVVVQPVFMDDLPAVSGDRVQLQQVILNLVLNATDAMANIEDRSRTLEISTELDGPSHVRLSVRDAGVGIDPRTIGQLFEAFHTTKAHGMGIGLSISRSIIESHGGRLWAVANDGPGATFCFCVPCVPGRTTGAAN